MKFLIPPRKYERLEGICANSTRVKVESGVSGIPEQGFRLSVQPDDILIEAADEAGAYYGSRLLAELRGQSPDEVIPCCRIEDWPDFRHRGYMLDISRDRVPTMEHLFHLVDILAKLRYNQLQLYTEHTFAYSKHHTVWANASPMTAAEIRGLDTYCRERHIELVPNQNSFGHMERWLMHDAYKHLAECPEGFRHPLSGEWRPQGSVLKPDQQSLDFLDGLYSELLPNFSSQKFNIGGDEPWELGKGASAAKVKEKGKRKVYADFLSQLCQLAAEHDAEPMCWADVLLEDPNQIKILPDSIQPIIWGYEHDHPFETQCARLADLGRSFYVAPGDSTWNSYTGRFPTMFGNVRAAARMGQKYGASGLLMTHWGDGGHAQAWPVSLPGMVWAGLCSWKVNTEETRLESGLRSLLGDKDGAYVRILIECGDVDNSLGVRLPNKSYLAIVNQLTDEKLKAFDPRPDESSIQTVKLSCEDWIDALPEAKLSGKDASWLCEELLLMLRMNHFAAHRILGESVSNFDNFRKSCVRCWSYRSRSGGLEDSLSKIHCFKY